MCYSCIGCGKCGSEFAKECPPAESLPGFCHQCGTLNGPTARICKQCKEPLAHDTQGESGKLWSSNQI